MMDLLEHLKEKVEESGLICEIRPESEDVFPDVTLEPLSEEWEHDNLGNRKSKEIEFNVFRYVDDNVHYADNVKQGIDFIEQIYSLLKNKEILNIVRCKTWFSENKDKLLVEVKANFIIKLYKRGR